MTPVQSPGIEVSALPDYDEAIPCQCRWLVPWRGETFECGEPSDFRLRIHCVNGHDYTTFNCRACYVTWAADVVPVTCRVCDAPLTDWSTT